MRAIYAFSGDPITYGHIDVVRRAARTYDEVVVAIGANPQKQNQYLFGSEERLLLARRVLAGMPNVRCVTFTGLLGEYAYRHGFDVIVRGVRNVSDLESELILFSVNESLHETVDTVFFPTRRHLAHISSGVVKAIVREGGEVSQYCPLGVKEELEKRILGRFMVAVAGGIAAGKTRIADKLVKCLAASGPATYISLDAMGHSVLGPSDGRIYQATRARIAERFGAQVRNSDGTIDRKALGRIVFADPLALADLDQIMREPMLARLYEETRNIASGVIVIEGAIFVEAHWTNLVNNNVILVDAPEDVRVQRLMDRNSIARDEAATKIRRQLTATERAQLLRQRIAEQQWGRIWELDTNASEAEIARLAGHLRQIADARVVQE